MFGVTVFVSDEMPAGTEMILVDADQLAVDPGRHELASTTQADLRLDSETRDGPARWSVSGGQTWSAFVLNACLDLN
jgi:hypothetical protein